MQGLAAPIPATTERPGLADWQQYAVSRLKLYLGRIGSMPVLGALPYYRSDNLKFYL